MPTGKRLPAGHAQKRVSLCVFYVSACVCVCMCFFVCVWQCVSVCMYASVRVFGNIYWRFV